MIEQVMDFVYYRGLLKSTGYRATNTIQSATTEDERRVIETNRTVGCVDDCMQNKKYLFKELNNERN